MNRSVIILLLLLSVTHSMQAQIDSMLDYSKYALQFYEEFDYPDPSGAYPSIAFKDTTLHITGRSADSRVTTNGLGFRKSWDIYRDDEWGAGNELYMESQVTMPEAGIIRLQETQTPRSKTRNNRRIDYLSGSLLSKNMYSHGIYEARVKFSQNDEAKCGNSGVAFWTAAGYSNFTEIDIMDNTHDNWLVQRVSDWEPYNYRSLSTNTVSRGGAGHSLTDSFHIVSCEWRPDIVRFYFDGKYVSDVDYTLVRTYDDKYQFILAIAACAAESLNPDSSTDSGHYVDIDWVKYWRPACTDSLLDLNTVSGLGFLGAQILPGMYYYRQVTMKPWIMETFADTYNPTIIRASVTDIPPGFQADQSVLHTVNYGSDQSTRVRNGYFEIVSEKGR